jgi:hypothetical protein
VPQIHALNTAMIERSERLNRARLPEVMPHLDPSLLTIWTYLARDRFVTVADAACVADKGEA